jgi:hypothetical protein
MMNRILTVLAAASLCVGGCSRGLATTAPIPRQAGVYPPEVEARDTRPGKPVGWRSVDQESPIVLHVDAKLSDLLQHAPPTGTLVPVRSVSWPSSVYLSAVGSSGLLLESPWMEPSVMAADVRCATADQAQRIRVAVEVAVAGSGVRVVPHVEESSGAVCELSAGGRMRLRRVAMDVYLWVRSTAATNPSSVGYQ